MPGAGLTHDVVICTRNRPDELADCLASIAEQTLLPMTVFVVDASDVGIAAKVDAVGRQVAGVAVSIVQTEPSTAAQRNLGVGLSTADVVHFLDDDTVLEPGYLAAIMATFEDRDGVGLDRILGVGGQPTNLLASRAGLLQRRISPESTRPGAVLASGRGVLASGLTRRTDVDWLSGCCMSFRREALVAEPFDEAGDGYLLGEDLEMSYRVRQHGRLVVEPAARLIHLESPRNRWDRRLWARTDVVNRRFRVDSGVGAYRLSAFWIDGVVQLALWSIRSLRPRASYARATALGIAAGLVASSSGKGVGGSERRQRVRSAT